MCECMTGWANEPGNTRGWRLFRCLKVNVWEGVDV